MSEDVAENDDSFVGGDGWVSDVSFDYGCQFTVRNPSEYDS
jgi:hypothetical protein